VILEVSSSTTERGPPLLPGGAFPVKKGVGPVSSGELPQTLCEKRDRLLRLLGELGSCAVALSGGLDSAVLAKAAVLALGDHAIAYTATSPAMPSGELDDAVALAQRIGIRHEILPTDELADPEYRANTLLRCYFCKTRILGAIRAAAAERGLAVVVEGTHDDDRADYRPGRRAVREQGARSPLGECGFSKEELRRLAAAWDLPVWNKPATPCLASRIAYGEPITEDRLRKIDRAESFLRRHGFRTLRVRTHRDDLARIEVPADALARFTEEVFRREVVAAFREMGFRYVTLDLGGFRSGSLNEGQAIPPEPSS